EAEVSLGVVALLLAEQLAVLNQIRAVGGQLALGPAQGADQETFQERQTETDGVPELGKLGVGGNPVDTGLGKIHLNLADDGLRNHGELRVSVCFMPTADGRAKEILFILTNLSILIELESIVSQVVCPAARPGL